MSAPIENEAAKLWRLIAFILVLLFIGSDILADDTQDGDCGTEPVDLGPMPTIRINK